MTIKDFANEHRLKLRRDPGDETDIIPGREGSSHIFEYDVGLLAVMILPYTRPDEATAHRWKTARKAFESAGLVIRQDGDCEGIATFDPANPAQVKLAIRCAKVRPKRQISVAQRDRLRSLGNLRRKAVGIAVGSDLTVQDRQTKFYVVGSTGENGGKEMAVKAAPKPRKKKLKIPVEHAVYGPGVLEERRVTDSGAVLVVTFVDGSTRSLLAAPHFWLSLPDLAAIPIAKAATPEPVPEDDDEGDEPVMDEDDAKELVIE